MKKILFVVLILMLALAMNGCLSMIQKRPTVLIWACDACGQGYWGPEDAVNCHEASIHLIEQYM